MFAYAQINGGEEQWTELLAEHRETFLATKQPRFMTVLDVSALVTPSTTKEEIHALKFRGDWYADFDGSSLDEVTSKFQQFLGKLRERDVDLHACRLFATGGRGYHIHVPIEMFLLKPPKQGIQHLPQIYREIAYDLFVDCLDLRVYSSRKGRQFRTPNSKRENGAYKTWLTVDEALTMTAADYPRLISAPRPAPVLTVPVINTQLAVIYAKAEQRVVAAAKKRKESNKDLELLARFKGEFPPTLLKVMAGEIAAENFHRIAMQVAITAAAIGKKEEQVLTACEGLFQNHVSDGTRYNTPLKRRTEMSRMLAYTDGNPCYTYSRAAVRALVPGNVASPDLDGLPASAGSMTGAADNGNDDGLLGGVFLTEGGMFRRTEDGVLKLSDCSFKDITMLADALTERPLGFEADILVNGRGKGRQLIDLSTFLSKSNFSRFAMQHMAIVTANDNQVAAIAAILRDTAMNNGGMVYVVSREGLDLIQQPGAPAGTMDLVWVNPKAIETPSPVLYKHRGTPTIDGLFKSDLMDAPAFVATPETEAVIEALLNVNEPAVVAKVLGWLVGAFHKQIYHYYYSQFPLLMLYGQSGAGKSSVTEDMIALHYYLAKPLILQADASTPFAIEGAMQSSASIPCVLEEYKPREMRPGRHGRIKSMLRSAYNSQTFAKGGMATEVHASWRDLRSFAFAAPVMYIGEALETETATADRTVAAAMQKGGLLGRTQHHWKLRDSRHILSSLGRDIVRATFLLDFEEFRAKVDANFTLAQELTKRNNLRPAFNLAVILTSLDFLKKVLQSHFKGRFDEKIDSLKEVLMDVQQEHTVTVMAEASKLLNVLSLMSQTEDPMSEFGLRIGRDYAIHGDLGQWIDVNMRFCWVKYAGWAKRKGQPLYFDNEDAFMHGLFNFAPLVSRSCLTSPLKVTGMEKIYRFSVSKLEEEGVEPFKAYDVDIRIKRD